MVAKGVETGDWRDMYDPRHDNKLLVDKQPSPWGTDRDGESDKDQSHDQSIDRLHSFHHGIGDGNPETLG
jgi:hypothetical protein